MDKSIDQNGYPLTPRNISGGGWFYEQKSGIIAYHGGEHKVSIPWKLLTKAVDRHRRIQRKVRR